MKVWAEGKPGVEKVLEKLRAYGLEICSDDPEIVFPYGGDGTILKIREKYPKSCLLGIREKSVGYIAEIGGIGQLDSALERIKKGDYEIEEASMVELLCKKLRITGLNEVYFERWLEKYDYATRFRVFIDGKDWYGDELFGNGCMAASAKGSTAYNWSCGRGMLLSSSSKSFIFTPMSSMHLNKRTVAYAQETNDSISVAKPAEQILVPEDKEVVVRVTLGARSRFASDGLVRGFRELKKGDEITFRKSEETARFVKLPRPVLG